MILFIFKLKLDVLKLTWLYTANNLGHLLQRKLNLEKSQSSVRIETTGENSNHIK